MALHDSSTSPLSLKKTSIAEQILKSEKDRLWLDCFRRCKRRSNLSDTTEQYEFADGSTVVLDTSSAIPIPIVSNLTS